MTVMIVVKSGEYKISSNPQEILIAENLGTDISFSIYDIRFKKVLLARNVNIDEIPVLFEQFKDVAVTESFVNPLYLCVQLVGGRNQEQASYYGAVLSAFTRAVGSSYQIEEQGHVINIIGDDLSINIYGADILDKPHPDSVSICCASGIMHEFNDDVRSVLSSESCPADNMHFSEPITQKKRPLDYEQYESLLKIQESAEDNIKKLRLSTQEEDCNNTTTDEDRSSDHPSEHAATPEKAIDTNQRSTTHPDLSNDIIDLQDDIGASDDGKTQEGRCNESTTLSSIILNQLLSWVYELPEWLQQKIFSSTAIQSLIESIKADEKSHELPVLAGMFAEQESSDSARIDSFYGYWPEQAKAYRDDNGTDLVDTSMIYDGTVEVLGSNLPFGDDYPGIDQLQYVF